MKRDAFPILFGVLVTAVLSGTLVIAGLKAGITPGVSPLVILVAWGAFEARARGPQGPRFLNLAQVAGSAGMAVTAGVIFTAPVIQIVYADRGLAVPAVDVPTLILLSLAGSLIGFGFVGLATKKFLSDPTLPAPEARACETMIETAAADRSRRPRLGRSLYAGLALSFFVPLLSKLGLAAEQVPFYEKHVPAGASARPFSTGIELSPIYVGIGGLLTLATALLVFGGSLLRVIGDYLLSGVAPGTQAALTWPENSMRWVGGAAMTVAVVYSLYRFFGVRSTHESDSRDEILRVDPQQRRFLRSSVVVGVLLLVGWLMLRDGVDAFTLSVSVTILVMSALMVTLGALLSLQIGSSASPVSGTIFVTTLVLCLVALATGRNRVEDVLVLTPLIVGACVAVCAANDSSQDYKTLQLCGVRVQDGFLAQLLGLLAGCVVVPIVLYVAHDAYTLGSPNLEAPQGKMFATLVEALLFESALPWTPIAVGLGLGVLAVLLDIWGQRRDLQLPSMALAVGIYLPAAIGIGILFGAACRWASERKRRQTHESILAAAGLITGAAFLELLLGIGILGGLSLEALRRFAPAGEAGGEARVAIPSWLPLALALLSLAAFGLLLLVNSKPRRV